MALQQTVDLTLASNIGEGGLPRTAIEAALSVIGKGMKRIAGEDVAGMLPLLQMPRTADDLETVGEAASWLRRDATDVVFLGTA